MTNSTEISGLDLKDHYSSCKHVTFQQEGCNIRGKLGRVEYDFPEFGKAKCFVHMKRVSGNGKVVIVGQNHIVTSKIYQTFDIDVDGKIEFVRPKDSTGDIVLLGLTFASSKVGESTVGISWKDLINKCGQYKNLRLIKSKDGPRLFASIGGFIEDGSMIKIIETNPPSAIKKDGNKIIFNTSCEITNLVLSGNPAPSKSTEIHNSRKPPTKISMPQPALKESGVDRVGGNAAMRTTSADKDVSALSEHILYDSSTVSNFQQFVGSGKGGRPIRSNKVSYLVLGRGQKTRAAISSLKPNTDYICIMNAKMLNGNGKIFVGFSDKDSHSDNAVETVFNNKFNNKYIRIRTDNTAPGVIQKLHLFMPDKFSKGELLIQRIMIVHDLGVDSIRAKHEGQKYLNHEQIRKPINTSSYSGSGIDIRTDDPVYVSAKKFALYPPVRHASVSSDVVGTIMSNTVDGMMWASRVKSAISRIRLGNMRSEVTNDSLLVSHVGALKSAKKIWIEPFKYGAVFSKSDREAISQSQTILSPSVSNVQYLAEAFPDKKVERAHLPLFWTEPQADAFFNQNEFVLVFKRDGQDLERLFSAWSHDLPKLVVFGARGKYPDFVIPVTEYYPYEKLLFLIKKARFIVDLSNDYEYHSSLLDLANYMGKTILTNNWFMLSKNNGIMVQADSQKSVGAGINRAMKVISPINDMSGYNDKFVKQMTYLLL
jgi:hypothetical protein